MTPHHLLCAALLAGAEEAGGVLSVVAGVLSGAGCDEDAGACVAAGPVGPLPLLPFARLTATSLARRICGSLLTVKS